MDDLKNGYKSDNVVIEDITQKPMKHPKDTLSCNLKKLVIVTF